MSIAADITGQPAAFVAKTSRFTAVDDGFDPAPTVRLDTEAQALRDLGEVSIDLHPRQAVCGGCHLVYWKPLGYCPECAG
jgi:hypothetical protein